MAAKRKKAKAAPTKHTIPYKRRQSNPPPTYYEMFLRRKEELAKVAKQADRSKVFESIDFEQVYHMVRKGWEDDDIADALHIHIDTLRVYKLIEPFKTFYNEGLQAAVARVERSLFERANGFEHPEEVVFQYQGEVIRAKTTKKYPPDFQSMSKFLNNKAPDKWSDKGNSGVNQQVIIQINNKETETNLKKVIASL